MTTLRNIMRNCRIETVEGDLDREIRSITFDSRKVCDGCVFFAVRGTQTDGHEYIDKAVENGAAA